MPTPYYDRTNGKTKPTGRERPWREDEVIVSKTNLKGHITYANDVFMRVAQMEESDLLDKPHNLIRHPHMPRCVFKLLWDTVAKGQEIFAYVNNMAKSGDNYWVFAHVTPNFDAANKVSGYTSFRRKPSMAQVQTIGAIYNTLLEEEGQHTSPKDALEASTNLLNSVLKSKGMAYDEFVFSF